MAPSLLQLAGMAFASDLPTLSYGVGIVIMALLGGLVSLVYKEKITHKAFALGVSWPALLYSAGGAAVDLNLSADTLVYAQATASNNPSLTSETHVMRLVFVPRQQIGEELNLNDASLEVETPQGVQSVPLVDPMTIQEKLPDGIDPSSGRIAHIPKSVQSVYLDGVSVTRSKISRGYARITIQTTSVPVPEGNETLELTFEEIKPFWSGFYEAVGMNKLSRQLYQYHATVEAIEPQALDTDRD